MAQRKRTEPNKIYQINISLRGARPPIWRRVLVPDTFSLAALHQVIQTAMGWYNAHLHEFDVGGVSYGEPHPDYFQEVRDERKVTLSEIVAGEKFKFRYQYDFGDSWDHDLLVEKVLPVEAETDYPVCIKGKRACPPEDVGGV